MDLRSWPKRWNDASWRNAATLPEFSPSRPWPLFGMLALGLVAGAALGGYAVTQRSRMKKLAMYAHRMSDELSGMDGEGDEPIAVVTTRSNHRRKTTSRA